MFIALTLRKLPSGLFLCSRTEYLLPTHTHHSPARPFSFHPSSLQIDVSSLALFASSLLFCSQSAQGAKPRLLHMAGLCFSIPFASCCFSFSLALQATVTTMCYGNIWICFSLGVCSPWLCCQV